MITALRNSERNWLFTKTISIESDSIYENIHHIKCGGFLHFGNDAIYSGTVRFTKYNTFYVRRDSYRTYLRSRYDLRKIKKPFTLCFTEMEWHWTSDHGMNYEKKRTNPLFVSVSITLWFQWSQYDLQNSQTKNPLSRIFHGAPDKTWTCTGRPIRPSSVRVCRFHHWCVL